MPVINLLFNQILLIAETIGRNSFSFLISLPVRHLTPRPAAESNCPAERARQRISTADQKLPTNSPDLNTRKIKSYKKLIIINGSPIERDVRQYFQRFPSPADRILRYG